ncbi:RNA methyltransferase [Fusobacterium sp.]|uniref:TrmH family RNA methyltransferase n=1 Tax=Fusobacterium sp. TaxID=68766 RepID=UPI0025C10262|nr:RNA methyltransferase [Fusobacterium sp.]
MEYINSLDNNTVKKIKKLKQRKYRELNGEFIAEGRKFLDFLYEPNLIVLKEGVENEENIAPKLDKFKCRKLIVGDKIFKELTSQENSQGVILVYPYCESSLEKLEDNIIVLNNVQDPGNLGTIIRVGDAAGFKDIILTKGSVDVYNEKSVRSSMGSIFNMNIVYMEENELLKLLKERGYKLHVTALEKNSIEYTQMKLEEKNAVVFGSEGNGVSKEMLESADETVIIPIFGSAESLNVAMASGIILYKVRELIKR